MDLTQNLKRYEETLEAAEDYYSTHRDHSMSAMELLSDYEGPLAEALHEAIRLQLVYSLRSGTFPQIKAVNRELLKAMEEFIKEKPAPAEKLEEFQESNVKYMDHCEKVEKDYIEYKKSISITTW